MDDAQADRAAFDTAERLLGAPLVLLPGTGASGAGQVLRREATALRVWVSPASGWSRRTGGQAGACQQVVSIPARAGTAPQNEPLGGRLPGMELSLRPSRARRRRFIPGG
jgi:hypothetical protein